MGGRTALLSVSDKRGIVELGRGLAELGFRLLSTGGTARALRAAGIEVVEVADFTGFPEVFGGRVKTLHPRIAGGVLGRRGVDDEEAARAGIEWIDLVAVNLYPFESAAAAGVGEPDAIEQVDIGGPTLVRAAAKNHEHVVVLVDPDDYGPALEALRSGGPDRAFRRRLALRAFRHTARYDAVIADWMARRWAPDEPLPAELALPLRRVAGLRYGENPHQRAAWYADPARPDGRALHEARQLQGRPLSFNNLADADAAIRAVFDLEGPGCVVVKHANPCGAAVHPDGPAAAFALALSADPVSAFGGIVAFNQVVDAEAVRAFRRSRTFFEVLAAPGFTEEARALLAPRAKLRVLELPADWAERRRSGVDARRVAGGWLLQEWDAPPPPDPSRWRVVTRRAPTPDELRLLAFAWTVARHVRSNAVALACTADGGIVVNGVGAGQMSRVESVRLAVGRARRPVEGSVLASDGFFPFPDGVEAAGEAGVRAVVQPGGSVRDEEVVAAADRLGIAMVTTGARHFRH